ncbi:MAG: hypothetical protein AAF434_10480 [Pseudomonadota bacterium]
MLKTIAIVVISMTLLSPSSGFALTPPSTNEQVPNVSREEAAKRAQKQLGGGKVLGVKLRNQQSTKPYFDVKLLENGKVRVLRIDAE